MSVMTKLHLNSDDERDLLPRNWHLQTLTPDPLRAERVRLRCRGELERQRPQSHDARGSQYPRAASARNGVPAAQARAVRAFDKISRMAKYIRRWR
jgi:hypothetical protein